MTKLTDLALQLKTAANELLGELGNIDNQIETLHRQRDTITSAHVSKADYLSYLTAHFKIKADRFEIAVLREVEARNVFDFGNLERGFVNKDGFQGLQFLTAYPTPVEISETALYFYFGDVFIERIGHALEAHEWPDNAMPAEARRKALTDIEVSIKELQQRRDDLVKSIDDAGISR
jgi:hypothetical protein